MARNYSERHPLYSRLFPATAIVCFEVDADGAAATRLSVTTPPRGTMSCELPSEPVCEFRTAFDLQLAPVTLSKVEFNPIAHCRQHASLTKS
ncbi:type VI secretion system baseplate subunit TssF [Janthinobacterium sp.]|uniref:type VI secretion system baseplate subunit TssF n=1 Tax=Janthinobacterium sp. TaxID=1871054 RepID=UPI0034179A77